MQKLSIIIILFIFSTSFGQNSVSDTLFISTNDSISGGTFSLNLDKGLANLILSKEGEICQKYVNPYTPPKKLTPADKCASQQKIMGYKIQIFYTKDREAANKVKNEFARKFPGLTPELIYASPDYRILVGDYFTRSTASSDLRRIQKTYPAAFTVQWRVWCRKAI